MELTFENGERLRKVHVGLRRQIRSKDAQIEALRQRIEDDARKIAGLRAEVANLEFWLAEKQKGLDARHLPRAVAQLKQLFPGIQFKVEVPDAG